MSVCMLLYVKYMQHTKKNIENENFVNKQGKHEEKVQIYQKRCSRRRGKDGMEWNER